MKKTALLVGSLALAVWAIAGFSGQQASGDGAGEAAAKENGADVAAIKKAGDSFLKAYLAGDAKKMAAHWTENGEYFADDGTTIRGRAEIEKVYTELFAKKKGVTDGEIEVTSIRFPSKDTAIEEGYFRIRAANQAPTSSKYTVLHVREDGKWLMAVVREWPSDGVSLRDLDWLIGTWEAKRGDTEIRTTYEWWGDKSFIRVAIQIKEKNRTSEGFQMIGKDTTTGQLRSWTFDRSGSFGEATWSRDGKKWTLDSTGVLDDGGAMSATNVITQLDNDTFTFQSVERTVGGQEAADIPPVRVTRVKGK